MTDHRWLVEIQTFMTYGSGCKLLRSVCQDVPDVKRRICEAQITESGLLEAPGTRGAGDRIAASRRKIFFR